ncbi:hypothetical protein C8J57DRAFT_1465800 [Mycena rebaudengoi]|nr:hypothetical protein C8J57DRAFT_1465800 [Mycena rebaudengoi]
MHPFLPNELFTEIIANAAPAGRSICAVLRLQAAQQGRRIRGDAGSIASFSRAARRPYIECIAPRTFLALRHLVRRAHLAAEPALLAFLPEAPAHRGRQALRTHRAFCCAPLMRYLATIFPALLALSGSSTPPHLPGVEIARKLADPPEARPPLLALTAHRAPDDDERMYSSACTFIYRTIYTRPPTTIRTAGLGDRATPACQAQEPHAEVAIPRLLSIHIHSRRERTKRAEKPSRPSCPHIHHIFIYLPPPAPRPTTTTLVIILAFASMIAERTTRRGVRGMRPGERVEERAEHLGEHERGEDGPEGQQAEDGELLERGTRTKTKRYMEPSEHARVLRRAQARDLEGVRPTAAAAVTAVDGTAVVPPPRPADDDPREHDQRAARDERRAERAGETDERAAEQATEQRDWEEGPARADARAGEALAAVSAHAHERRRREEPSGDESCDEEDRDRALAEGVLLTVQRVHLGACSQSAPANTRESLRGLTVREQANGADNRKVEELELVDCCLAW